MENGNGLQYYGHAVGTGRARGSGIGAGRGYVGTKGGGYGYAHPYDSYSMNSKLRGVVADGVGNGTAGFAYSGDGLGSPEMQKTLIAQKIPSPATAAWGGLTMMLLGAAPLDIIIMHAQVLTHVKTLKGHRS